MKILAILFLSLGACLAQAKDLTIVTPNTPGSTSDLAAKAIAEAYQKNTGYKIIVENIGGGHQIPGIMAWKSRPVDTVMMTTTGILVFNPKLMKDLPYSDKDFNHVTMIAAAPSVWVVKNDSPYKTMKDLVKKLPHSQKPFVAYANYPEVVNLHLLAKKFSWKPDQVQAVKYRGVPEAVIGIIEGSIEVGVLSLNAGVIEMIRSNRLRVLASTNNAPIVIADQTVLPASQLLDVEQFSGGIFLSLRSDLDPEVANKLKKDLISAINDPIVEQRLKQQNQTVINKGSDHMQKFINSYRDRISSMKFD